VPQTSARPQRTGLQVLGVDRPAAMIAMEVKVGDISDPDQPLAHPLPQPYSECALTAQVPDKEGLYHSATPKAPYDPPFYERVDEPQQTSNIINSVLPSLRSEVFMASAKGADNRLDFIAQKEAEGYSAPGTHQHPFHLLEPFTKPGERPCMQQARELAAQNILIEETYPADISLLVQHLNRKLVNGRITPAYHKEAMADLSRAKHGKRSKAPDSLSTLRVGADLNRLAGVTGSKSRVVPCMVAGAAHLYKHIPGEGGEAPHLTFKDGVLTPSILLHHPMPNSDSEEEERHTQGPTVKQEYNAQHPKARPAFDAEVLIDYDESGKDENKYLQGFEGQCITFVSQNADHYVACIFAPTLRAFFMDSNRELPLHLDLLPEEPESVEAAMNHPQWRPAMDAEMRSLGERKTWELAYVPPGRRALGVKWVWTVKTTATGQLDKLKARLVAKGYNQIPGKDFSKVYAPVGRYDSFRMLMALAAAQRFSLKQLDISSAFLYGKLDENELYIQQPPGYDDGTGRACRLIKSLYGLKQAPMVWYSDMEETLRKLGWTKIDTDWGLFKGPDGQTFCLLYVDDMLLGGPDTAFLVKTAEAIGDRYQVKVENLTKYLGMNLRIGQGYIGIDLGRYAGKVAKEYNLHSTGKVTVPLTMDPNREAARVDEGERGQVTSKAGIRDYQGKVGTLQWAASTVRPDLLLASSKLAQGSKGPTQFHVDQVQRSLKYLVDTPTLGITYRAVGEDTNILYAYCDAAWERSFDSHGQSHGYVIFLNGGAISYGSKKHTTSCLSSAEAELTAAVTCTQEVIHLRRQMMLMGFPQPGPTKIYTDSEALRQGLDTQASRLKHTYRRNWLQEKQLQGEVVLVGVPGEYQCSDILTKVLERRPFQACRRGLGITAVKGPQQYDRFDSEEEDYKTAHKRVSSAYKGPYAQEDEPLALQPESARLYRDNPALALVQEERMQQQAASNREDALQETLARARANGEDALKRTPLHVQRACIPGPERRAYLAQQVKEIQQEIKQEKRRNGEGEEVPSSSLGGEGAALEPAAGRKRQKGLEE